MRILSYLLVWRLLDLPYIDLNKVDLHHLSTEIAAGAYEKAGFRTQAWSLPLGCLLCKPGSSEESFSTLVLERQRQSLLSKSTNLMGCSHLLTSFDFSLLSMSYLVIIYPVGDNKIYYLCCCFTIPTQSCFSTCDPVYFVKMKAIHWSV